MPFDRLRANGLLNDPGREGYLLSLFPLTIIKSGGEELTEKETSRGNRLV